MRESLPFENVEVVIVLRRQDEYLESLYNEQVKVTRYNKNIFDFFEEYKHRFEYRKQIELWEKNFEKIHVKIFRDIIKTNSVTNALMKSIGVTLPAGFLNSKVSQNASMPFELVELKRILNGSYLGVETLQYVQTCLANGLNTDKLESDLFDFSVTRLSMEYRREMLERFQSDNQWILRSYFHKKRKKLFENTTEISKVKNKMDEIALKNSLAFLVSCLSENKK